MSVSLLVIRPFPPPSSGAIPTTYDVTMDAAPASRPVVYQFTNGIVSQYDFLVYLAPSYSGTGIDVVLPWSGTGVGSATLQFDVGLRSMAASTDLSATPTITYVSVQPAQPLAPNTIVYSTVSLDDGAQLGNLSIGDYGILRVRRPVFGTSTDPVFLFWPVGLDR